MSPLFLLLRMHVRAFFRRQARNLSTPKGIILTVLGAVLVTMWLGSVVVGTFMGRSHKTVADLEAVRRTVPVGLLCACAAMLILSGGAKAITFTPAETDFLFPGPFSRRQILLYRMARNGLGATVSALFVGFGLRQFAVSWAGTYFSTLVMMLFLQSFVTLAALITASLAERMDSRRVRAVLAGVVVAAGAVAYQMAPVAPAGPGATTRQAGEFVAVLTRLRDSAPVQAAAMPFRPFAYAMTAQSWAELAGWTLASAAVLTVTVLLTLRVDADFMEASTAASLKRAAIAQKARRSGISAAPPSSRLRLPAFPRLGGAGPIAWRQAVTAVRALRVLLVVLVMAVVVGPMLLRNKGVDPSGPLFAVVAFFTFMGGTLFRFDFRADIDRLDTLKSLPVRPFTVTVGQLATPTVLLVGFQWLALAVLAYHYPGRSAMAAWMAAFAPLVSLFFMSVENLVFLLFPHRQAVAPGDLAAIARNLLITLCKLGGLAVTGGVAVGAFFLVRWITSSDAAGAAVAWAIGAGLALGSLPVVAWAFVKLDVVAEASPDA